MAEKTITVRLNRSDSDRLGELSNALGAIAPGRSAVVGLLLRAVPTAAELLAMVARRSVDALPKVDVDDGSVPAAEVARIRADMDDTLRRVQAEHANDVQRRGREAQKRLDEESKAAYEKGYSDGSRWGSDQADMWRRALQVLAGDDDDASYHARQRLAAAGMEIVFGGGGKLIRIEEESGGAAES